MNDILNITKCNTGTAIFFREFDSCIAKKRIEDARMLIVEREAAVKKNRRKLLRPQEYRFDALVHYFKLSYRYGTARQIMMDIIEGMGI